MRSSMSALKVGAKSLVAGAIIVGALAAPAVAGSRSSHFYDWHPFQESSHWDDTGNSFGTKLGIKQCTYSINGTNKWITFQLHREDTWTPNENYELQGVDCWSTSDYHYGSWGNKGSGEFYWRIRYVCGYDTAIYASTPSVVWNW